MPEDDDVIGQLLVGNQVQINLPLITGHL